MIQETEAAKSTATVKGIGLENAFPKLRFNRPIHLTHVGDDRIFVAEQNGVIHVFQNDAETSTTEVFLDISDRISRVGNEEGLIGLAFHPDFKNNGQFFVHYSSSVKDMHGIVARYRVKEDDPSVGDPNSEEVIIEQEQPFRNHNGGALAFGPTDGYLYISFGDGGKANDPLGSGQDLSTLLGAILRIDVDHKDPGLEYAIPKDNHFASVEGARGEIFACGLRNVWRFSIDRKTGELWAGDVGQDRFDEIDLVRNGGNYGWNRWEADASFRKQVEMATEKHDQPIASYGRQWGLSVTGGNVYRGKKFPELDGVYFYGDYLSGNLWQIRKDENGDYKNTLVRRTGQSIAAFGEDTDGEVYLLSFDGKIYRVQPTDEPENFLEGWPKKLSETEIFADLKKRKMSDAYTPYEVNAPFWSDSAEKTRFFRLPEGEKIGYRSEGSWAVPVGTEIIKNFRHAAGNRMLETRVIKRIETGWEAATYIWDKRGKDAELRPEGLQLELWMPVKGAKEWRPTTWHGPSSSECASCHVDSAGYVLGLNTAQLNNADGPKNQIMEFVKQELLSGVPEDFDASAAARHCDPHDKTCDLEQRARVYLDVNCAMCHRPNGPGNASIDLRFATDLDATKMINEKPAQGDLGIAGARIVKPGDAASSLLLQRIDTISNGRMPNIGSNVIDENAVELLREWIELMDASSAE
ncbi:PQQ-dependent sugar dehydrogenase [Mariniblastus fucicola]|uniref:PQQ-dependent sugar dehydrogenase n=1 Tax=Mariniblastus fucicola TaxID=980251 RepID=UPI0012F89BE2|nr:PQQ-dependent sugar dehydrogenase [Mariniblastus fucicola]